MYYVELYTRLRFLIPAVFAVSFSHTSPPHTHTHYVCSMRTLAATHCTVTCTQLHIHENGEERSHLGPAWGASADGERGRGLWHGGLQHTRTRTHTHTRADKRSSWWGDIVCVSVGPAFHSDTIAPFGKEVQAGTSRFGNVSEMISRIWAAKLPDSLFSVCVCRGWTSVNAHTHTDVL